jgi:hypothetical protein
MLFTDEEEFTRDGIVKFHHTHIWVDDNPHITVASKHPDCLSTSVRVGISGGQHLRPVVLPKRLAGAVHHRFLANDLPILLEYVKSGAMRFPPHCLTALEPDSGSDAEAQSAGLPDLLTLIIWIFGVFSADQ